MTAKAVKQRWLRIVLPVLLIAAVMGIAALLRSATEPAEAVQPPPSGIVCAEPDPTIPETPTFRLRATSGFISVPDGNSIFMWSYAVDLGVSTRFQYPGPTLCVDEGDVVTVHLANDLPEPVSILFPGQEGVRADGVAHVQPEFDTDDHVTCLTDSAAPSGSVTYSFVASEPGTYIYESGCATHKQPQMGLIGALIVRPSMGPGFAYNDLTTEFNPDREFLLLFHEIDPLLHQAVEEGLPYDVTQTHFRYWTINGRSMPDTIAPNGAPWLPSQPYGALVTVEPIDSDINPLPALARFANAGTANHPFHPHANHGLTIAQDGRQLKGLSGEDLAFESFTAGGEIAAGSTKDILMAYADVELFDPDFSPIPVEIPGLQNLVFFDDTTFYAGSPYLGVQGELPPAVTSYNQCGEQYFPWHSHALFEFQNFDEGFGGMATLFRVDPPGGC